MRSRSAAPLDACQDGRDFGSVLGGTFGSVLACRVIAPFPIVEARTDAVSDGLFEGCDHGER